MKRLLLAVALLSAVVPAESAPSDQAKASIMKAVRDGMTAREAMRVAIRARDAATDDPEIALLHWTAARTAQSEMKSDFDLAIRLTQDAYRLKPQTPPESRTAKSLSPFGAWSSGLPAPWAPEFGTWAYREIRGTDGRLHYVSVDPKDAPTPDDVGAFTDPDGKVTILPSLLERLIYYNEPGLLASALHHEAVHYMELITTGRDTHEQMEMRADRASLAMVDAFMPGLSAKARERAKDALRARIASYEALATAGDMRSPFPDPEQEKRFEEAFRRQESRGLEYHDLVRRVERLERDRRENLEASHRIFRWAKFNLWTLNSCVYINGTTRNSPEWGRPDLIRARDERLRGYLRGNFVVLPSAEIESGHTYGGDSDIARCQDRMIRLIRDLPAPVEADWMMDRIEYERRGGQTGEILSGVIESVRRAVVDGTAAFVRTATSPGTAARGSGTEGPERDPGGGERESRLPGGDNYPRDQLRGIDARERW